MPIIKSAIKRARQSAKRRQRNLGVKLVVKKEIKSLLTSIKEKNKQAAETNLRTAISKIDRSIKKGTIHKNTAARRKSRLTRLVNQLTATPKSKSAKDEDKAASSKAVDKSTKAKAATKKSATKKPSKKSSSKKT